MGTLRMGAIKVPSELLPQYEAGKLGEPRRKVCSFVACG